MFDKNDEKKKEILKVCNIYLQIKKEGKDNKIKISEITIGNNNEKLDKDKFNSLISSSSPDQKIKKNLEKLKKIYQILKRRLVCEYKSNFELKLHIKFEKKRENEGIYIINVTYTEQENKKKFTDDNIFIIENESNLKGFNSLLDYINKDIKNENINKSENNKEEKIIADENKDDCDAKNKKDNLNRIVIDYEKDKIKIMTKKETYQFNSDLIKEIYSDVYLLVDNEKNLVKIVDKDWKDKIENLKDFNDKIINIYDITLIDNNKEDLISIIIFGYNGIYLANINIDKNETDIKKLFIHKYDSLNIKEANIYIKNYKISYKEKTSDLYDLFTNSNSKEDILIYDKNFFNEIIKINENIIVLTSNTNLPNGDDLIIFYDLKEKETKHIINNYSFVMGRNGLLLLTNDYSENKNKFLLCACKKYSTHQKNGILLIKPEFKDNEEIKKYFYETTNFEVYCLCPILNIVTDKKILVNNYFFVGGFDTKNREGKIRLYRINYEEEDYKNKIEHLQDIVFQDEEINFKGAIISLIQSKTTGSIIASCYDGFIHEFTQPNLSFYLENDI
jgi:hypothetical protein